MKRFISGSLWLSCLIVLFAGCRKKAFDDYYGRPENLAPPIYQQLAARGDFTSLLKVIDKTTYKQTLSAAGSWTFFAPNDAAFAQFITEQGLKSVDDIPPDLAEKIVRYSMIYDGEKSDRLSDYLSASTGSVGGFEENEAFRRRTLYYDFVYDGINLNGTAIKAIATNRNGIIPLVQTDFNNKHIPVILSAYMDKKQLTASDYEFFYPGSKYTGFNVGPASVSTSAKDIEAENGVIHVIDKVLLPQPSIEQYMSSNTNYSAFKNLLEKFATYSKDDAVSRRYGVLTGKSDPVYIKQYTALPFSPNNENYLKANANDAQKDAYTMVIPTNQVLQEFARTVLLKYYPGITLDQFASIRSDVILELIRAHMVANAVWPGKFNTTANTQGEVIRLSLADVVDKKLLSNGFFYGVNKVQDANIFSSVYAKIYLDPKFSFFRAAVDLYGYGPRLRQRSSKYAVIPVSNALLNKMGFTYEADLFPNAPVRYNGAADASGRLSRIIGTHIIDLNFRDQLPVLTGRGFLNTAVNEPDNNEYIRYDNNRLFSSGTLDSGYTALPPTLNGLTPNSNPISVKVDSAATGNNGMVIYAAGLLSFTPNEVGLAIQRNADVAAKPFFKFYQYLSNSTIYNATSRVITGVDAGLPYTVFVPNNAAIDQAVAGGVLPAAVNPVSLADKEKVATFIRYHILNKTTVAADGHILKLGSKATLLQDAGEAVPLVITENTSSSLKVKDSFGRIATVINPQTSLLSNRTVIHEIDTYLRFVKP